MKHVLFLAFIALITTHTNAQHQLTKLWSTDTTLNTPESVLYDDAAKLLYVSLIKGDASAKDGDGGVAKVGLDGKIINANWITGLNAPKGLGKFGNTLYAADVDEIVAIDIDKGTVIKKYPVEGATFLNDITVDAKGVVYVTDSRTGKVHTLTNGTVATLVDGLKGPNGILAAKDGLYVLASGSLLKINDDKSTQTIAEGMDASTDGIEEVKPGEFIVSCWAGVVYYVKADGSKQQLFDTRDAKINSADIGYDAQKMIVYVPTFLKNSVMAYQLK